MAAEPEHPELPAGFLEVTPAARGLLLDAGVRGNLLTVAFTTGCGGAGYRLALAAEPAAGLHVWTDGEVTVYLDGMAADRLAGARIDLDDDAESLTLDHPDAVEVAWCG